METFNELNRLNQEHKNLLNNYLKLFDEASKSDLVTENNKLLKEIDEQAKKLENLEKKIVSLSRDNQELKNTLLEQIIDEKIQLVKISREKLTIYFQDKIDKSIDRLTLFERELKSKFYELEKRIQISVQIDKEELFQDLSLVKDKIKQKLILQKEQLRKNQEDLLARFDTGMKEFHEEVVNEETVKKRLRRNKMEMRIGLSWFNKIGIVLILISIALAAYYNRENINDYVKGISFYIFGLAFIVAGELFYRKEKNQFAQGLIGGGVAILFTSVFVNCFVLEISSQNTSLFLSVLISFFTVVLSLRYKSKTIISLGLIGGYLPFITYINIIGFSGIDYYYGMGYLLVLNLIILIIAFRMKWFVVNFLSFILFFPGLIYMVFNCPVVEAGIIFASLAFILYNSVIIINPVFQKTSIHILDTVYFALNTIVGSLVIFLLFEKADLTPYEGLLSLAFCIIFYLTGNILSKYVSKTNILSIISYVTSLSFAILIIPFEFGSKWLSMGWLVEGILLIVFGVIRKLKYMEWSGWLLFAFCLFTFYFFDVPLNIFSENDFFPVKFFFVTAGLVLTYLIYHFNLLKNSFMQFGRITALLYILNILAAGTLFFFLNYIIIKGSYEYIYNRYDLPYKYKVFFNLFVFSFVSFSLARVFQLKKLANNINKGISIVLNILADLLFIYMLVNKSIMPSGDHQQFVLLGYLAFTVLIAYNVMIIINLRQTFIHFFKYNYTGLEWLPLAVAIFLLLNITLLIVIQFDFAKINLILSLIYLIYAVGSIVYGFFRKYTYIRYFGLGLSFFTLGKLFIWDLRALDESGKIIAYFSYGILLIAISFVYQKINKKSNLKNISNNESNN